MSKGLKRKRPIAATLRDRIEPIVQLLQDLTSTLPTAQCSLQVFAAGWPLPQRCPCRWKYLTTTDTVAGALRRGSRRRFPWRIALFSQKRNDLPEKEFVEARRLPNAALFPSPEVYPLRSFRSLVDSCSKTCCVLFRPCPGLCAIALCRRFGNRQTRLPAASSANCSVSVAVCHFSAARWGSGMCQNKWIKEHATWMILKGKKQNCAEWLYFLEHRKSETGDWKKTF